ncbi:hypothetical protein [Oryzifoliimicrobium ureilyticus]|uniref:hypothetical protein n=1 Tax=Oryzifoliimicrobium ureilyticus TaxID=3113724 RepID=UPI0030766CFE
MTSISSLSAASSTMSLQAQQKTAAATALPQQQAAVRTISTASAARVPASIAALSLHGATSEKGEVKGVNDHDGDDR